MVADTSSMDLKDFIMATVSGIVEATHELQSTYGPHEVIVCPPVDAGELTVYVPDSVDMLRRRVINIEFDLAVTVGSTTTGSGKAGIKVFSAEIGGSGEHARQREEASRVKFSLPIALGNREVEHLHIQSREKHIKETDAAKAAHARSFTGSSY